MFLSNTIRFIIEYFTIANIHGLYFTATKNRHWIERLFWVCVCLISWLFMIQLCLISWDAFQNKSTSFVTETNYLEFKTGFPAVSVCEVSNIKKISDKLKNSPGGYNFIMEDILQELTYNQKTFYRVQEFCSKDINCTYLLNAAPELAREIYGSCNESFARCHWKGTKFDCCKYFKPYLAETGRCYILKENHNTLEEETGKKLKELSTLTLEVKGQIKVILHSVHEEVNFNSDVSLMLPSGDVSLEAEQEMTALVALTDTYNDPGVKYLSKTQRRCLFPNEKDNLLLDIVYNQGNCIIDCRYRRQLHICNCSFHTIPKADKRLWCRTLEQYNCLHDNSEEWKSVDKHSKLAPACQCSPTCLDTEVKIVQSYLSENTEVKYPKINVKLLRRSSSVYRKIVVKGKMDFVVSIGGAASLFVGASLLSFCELIYFFSIRLAVNISRRRRRRKERKTSGQQSERSTDDDDDKLIIPFTL